MAVEAVWPAAMLFLRAWECLEQAKRRKHRMPETVVMEYVVSRTLWGGRGPVRRVREQEQSERLNKEQRTGVPVRAIQCSAPDLAIDHGKNDAKSLRARY